MHLIHEVICKATLIHCTSIRAVKITKQTQIPLISIKNNCFIPLLSTHLASTSFLNLNVIALQFAFDFNINISNAQLDLYLCVLVL